MRTVNPMFMGPTMLVAAVIVGLFSSIALADSPNKQPLANLSWSFGPPIPNAHQEAAGVEVATNFYVISGSSLSCSDAGGGVLTSTVDIYDSVTNTWAAGPSVNIARNEYPVAA